MMKLYKYILLCILLFFLLLWGNAQTKRQFNGIFTILTISSLGSNQYEISGQFLDNSNYFSASSAQVGDIIVDNAGNSYKLTTLESVSGSQITAVFLDLAGGIFPSGGDGIIYAPTSNGFPLITQSTPAAVLSATLNTSTISISNTLPTYSSGSTLPAIAYTVGSVVQNTGDSQLYTLTSSGWTLMSTSTISTSYSSPVTSTPAGSVGDVVQSYWDNNYYEYNGSTWVAVPQVSSLPSIPKYGDVFYSTSENKLYMMGEDGQWLSISGATTPEGPTSARPTTGNPGDLYYATDTNKLYVYTTSGTWVEVALNGSVPSGIINPDPTTTTVNEGTLFYNTSDHRLYVYNGTAWIPSDNALGNGQIYVGNASSIAIPVTMSGDATIDNTGKLTINNGAVTDAKLNKAQIPLSGFASPTDNVAMGDGTTNSRIINLANPTTPQDAATKSYVDALFSNPTTLLALPTGNLFVGNSSNKAVAALPSSLTISGFGSATANLSMGNGTTNYKINNLADPASTQDAATKNYVDTRVISPTNLILPQGDLLVGTVVNVAGPVAKNTIPLSGFGTATADISIGNGTTNYKLINLADPVSAQDAATKNYVDTKIINPGNITLATGDFFVGNASGVASPIVKNAISLSGFGTAATDISIGNGTTNYKLTNVANPVSAQDAATKNYVDTQLQNPSTSLALPAGDLFIGNASGKAVAIVQNALSISSFGAATTDVALGNASTQNHINFLADPLYPQDAATKNYVDTKIANPSSITLPQNYILVGNATSQAMGVAESSVPLSSFGSATANVSVGNGTTNYNINNLADPLLAQDAATKNYVDAKISSSGNIALATGDFFVGNASGVASPIAKNAISLSGFGTAATDISIGNGTTNYKLTNVANPVSAQDAATKNYVDTQLQNPSTSLALPAGDLFVGNASGTAAAVAPNTLPFSAFGTATANVSLGNGTTNYNINNLADPLLAQDAATKNYVDAKVSNPENIALATGDLFVGNASGVASPIAKNAISLSGFGDAEANVSMGTGSNNYKIINVADPTGAQDAATKNYVDSKVGSVQSGSTFPSDPTPGETFYSTTDNRLYVYNGTAWVPPDNSLPLGQLYVGNSSGIATATAKGAISLSGFGTATTDISIGNGTTNYKLTNVANPVSAQDAATKNYVDTQFQNPSTSLALPAGDLFIGNASGTAAAVAPNTLPLSAFGTATANVSVGNGTTNYNINNLADPVLAQDAATKNYVDAKVSNPENIALATGDFFVGNASGVASPVAKNAISLSGFGDAEANVSMGTGSNNYKIINVADPTGAQDAATKNYVDSKVGSVQSGSTFPSDPTPGETFYSTTDNRLYVYNGTAWVPTDNSLPLGQLYVGNSSGIATATAKGAISLSGFGTATTDISIGNGTTNYKLTNVANPVSAQDAATKNYVDTQLQNPSTSLALPTGDLFIGNASGTAAAVAPNTLPLSAFGTATANVSLGNGTTNYNINNLADPVLAQDAATKNYVDAKVSNPENIALATGDLFVGNASGVASPIAKNAISLSGFGDAEANVSMGTGSNNYKIINVADPTGAQDAATKNYVDTQLQNPSTSLTLPVGDLYVGNASNKATATAKNAIPLSGFGTATDNIAIGDYSINSDGSTGKGVSFDTSGNANFAQNVTINGSLYTPSDMRLKTNIQTLSHVLQEIEQIRGVRFEYKNQKKYATGFKIGVIAQELQKVYPEMVIKGSDGYLKVDYTQLTAVLIEAVKEQQVRIEELKNRLDKQQQQIDAILKKLAL